MSLLKINQKIQHSYWSHKNTKFPLILKADTHIKGYETAKTKTKPFTEIQTPGSCLGTESEPDHI